MVMSVQKLGQQDKLKENLVNTVEAAIFASASSNLVRMFLLRIFRPSSNMGHIKGKYCLKYWGRIFTLSKLKPLYQNVSLVSQILLQTNQRNGQSLNTYCYVNCITNVRYILCEKYPMTAYGKLIVICKVCLSVETDVAH